MYSKAIVSGAIGALMATAAFAETNIDGETLAWGVAGISSCSTVEIAHSEFRTEVVRTQAEFGDIVAALQVLSVDDSVCGTLSNYAADMLVLAETDRETFDLRFSVEDENVRLFPVEAPEGNGETEASVILAAAKDAPPQSSGSAPTPSSDYQSN